MLRRSIAAASAYASILTFAALAFAVPDAHADAPVPPNDDFAHATVLAGPAPSVAGTVIGGTVQPGESRDADLGSVMDASVWYRWVAPATAPFDAIIDGPSGSDLVTVWTGASVTSLHEVASSGPAYHLGTGNDAGFPANAGAAYYLQIATYDDGDREPFGLRLAQGSFEGTASVPDLGAQFNFVVDANSTDAYGSLLGELLGADASDASSSGEVATPVTTSGSTTYVLGPLMAGKKYLVGAFRSGPNADFDSFVLYPNTTNLFHAVQFTAPPTGCSYVGLDLDFIHMTTSDPTMTCPLAPDCLEARSAAPSASSIARAIHRAAASRRAVHHAQTRLKRAKKAHSVSTAKLKKRFHRLAVRARHDKAEVTRLLIAQALVTATCKPL